MRVRYVTMADADLLLTWRNAPDARSESRTSAEITPDKHRAWLVSVLNDKQAMLLIVTDDEGGPIGHIRFIPSGQGAEVSIVLDPKTRGAGLGLPALQLAQEHFRETHAETPVVAFVKTHNSPSHELFQHAGYVETSSDNTGVWYHWRKHG